jgi:hypothetical protein
MVVSDKGVAPGVRRQINFCSTRPEMPPLSFASSSDSCRDGADLNRLWLCVDEDAG